MTFRTTILVAMAVGIGWAQGPEDEAGRGVARLSLVDGDVSVRRGDSGDLIAAALNAPLVAQDQVITGPGARTELQFDWANMLRVSADSEVRLAELEYQRYLVQVARGMVSWRVLRDQDAYVEISTPAASVRPIRNGTYRVTVAEDGSADITVRSGEAEIFTPRGTQRLSRGMTMFVRGTPLAPEFRIGPEIPADDWDRWNNDRDRALLQSQSYTYVSPDIYGAEDLDAYGSWINVPTYSWVWNPRVASDWAPYRLGRWNWMDWYGWNWVSYDPWGWAPYHYGRWFYEPRHGWCWYPGSIGGRHHWAPAQVAFFGLGGAGVASNRGWGRIGWVPLAPSEPLHPWWGNRWYNGWGNPRYVNSGPITVNSVNVTNIYRNSRVNNAVTVIDRDGFRHGRGGLPGPGRFGHDELRHASLAQGPVPVVPGRESLRVADRDPRLPAVAPPRGDRFFSNRRPASVDRVPFDEQQRRMETIARQLNGGVTPPTAASAPAAQPPRHADAGGPRGSTEPVRSFTTDSSAPPPATPDHATGRSSDDWVRFGSGRVRDSGPTRSTGRFGQPEGIHREESGSANHGSADQSIRFGGAKQPAPSAPAPTGRFGGSAAPDTGGRGANQGNNGRERGFPPPPSATDNGHRGNFSGPGRSASSGESIRISPPIIRERNGGGGGGADHSGGSRSDGSPNGGRGDGGGRGSGGGGRGR